MPGTLTFTTVQMPDGRIMRQANVTPYLHGRSAARPRAESPDPDILRQMESLAAEIKRLKVESRQSRLALAYTRRIDELLLSGESRSRAVARASRENPDGRRAFLARSNGRLDGDVIKAQAAGRPLHDGSAADQTKADLFEARIAAEMERTPAADRRATIRSVGRKFPKLHAAWNKCKTGQFYDWHNNYSVR